MTRRYSSRRKSRRSSKDNSKVIATTLICLGILILGVITYTLLSARSENEKIDNKTGCRIGAPEQITVVLVDHTDVINTTQRAALEKNIWEIASNIPKNSLIEVYSVDRIIDHILIPEIHLCNPGDKSTVNDITGNKTIAQKRYENKFKLPLKELLDRLVNQKTMNESPIMESIQSVAVSAFIGAENKDAKKGLVLVSDLLENNNNFSLYGGIPDFDTYRKSSHYESVKSHLNDVDVTVLFLRRESGRKLQTPELWNFWAKFFESQGATIIERRKIEG